MRIYKNTTKRIAKKKCVFDKIQYGASLKPGDLVSTCKGYNEIISEIIPRWTTEGLSKGSYIRDFCIFTESGSSCSFVDCCTCPTETKEQILKYWLETWCSDEALEFCKKYSYPIGPIVYALREGKEVFDDDGQPFYEYCDPFERKARFPEREKV